MDPETSRREIHRARQTSRCASVPTMLNVCVCVCVCVGTDDAEIASLKDEVYDLTTTVLPRIQAEVADLKKAVAK